jgi:phosphoribosyl 1,2-cyclic phosphate phosphodiesterase
MKITLLGTGDAIGTPKIHCNCPQCIYAKNTGKERLRTSILVNYKKKNILVDSSPDLRRQLLTQGSPHIDAVIWTHGHYDHFMGFGEFYRVQDMPPVYAPPPVLEYCGEIFRFLSFSRHPIEAYKKFRLFDLDMVFVEVYHPPSYTCGLVIKSEGGSVAYTSDTRSEIPEKSFSILSRANLLLIDALVPPGYHIHKHMNYEEACRLAEKLRPDEFRCVHLSHNVPWDLPHLGWDGESFMLGEME